MHGADKTEEAIPALKKALSLAPGDLELYHLLTDIHIRIGQLVKAEESFR